MYIYNYTWLFANAASSYFPSLEDAFALFCSFSHALIRVKSH